MAQVASTDGSDIQALAPRRRFPSLSYLADGSGVGQDVQSVLQASQTSRTVWQGFLGLMFPFAEGFQGRSDVRCSRYLDDEFAGIDSFPFRSVEVSLNSLRGRQFAPARKRGRAAGLPS